MAQQQRDHFTPDLGETAKQDGERNEGDGRNKSKTRPIDCRNDGRDKSRTRPTDCRNNGLNKSRMRPTEIQNENRR